MTRPKLIALLVICVLAVGGAAAYFGYARSSAEAQIASAPAVAQTTDPAALLAQDHVVFRSAALDDTYSRLSVVSLADPAGQRAVLDATCERVYATQSGGVCLTADRGIVTTYGITELDAKLSPTNSSPLAGSPSRARISEDGSLISTTTFVTGHAYSDTSFSTDTVIRRTGGDVIGSIEGFDTTVDGQPLTEVDRNFWGITFVDDNTFYATAASNAIGKTWLVKGSISARTMTSVRADAECPSVAPDGTRVAYKTRHGNPAPGHWNIAVLDLVTGHQTVLAETRSVDDQVEWLDDSTVLYALPRDGSEGQSDVWRVPADGGGTAAVFIPDASSPAVVRH